MRPAFQWGRFSGMALVLGALALTRAYLPAWPAFNAVQRGACGVAGVLLVFLSIALDFWKGGRSS
jgi:hypothetical protein